MSGALPQVFVAAAVIASLLSPPRHSHDPQQHRPDSPLHLHLSTANPSTMPEQTHEFYAGMTCDGCKNAITRIVTKIPGVSSMSADVPSKRVLVTGSVGKEEVEEKLSKWAQASGKELRYVKTV